MNKKTFSALIILTIFSVTLVGCQGRLAARLQDRASERPAKSQTTQETEKEPSGYLAAGDYEFNIKHDGQDRYYLLHVPQNHKKPAALILAFHGGLGTGEIMSKYYNWKEKSDKEGFIVAFPTGASRFSPDKLATWNAGDCCGYAKVNKSDDVGFVQAVIEDIKGKIAIGKVFATGMSNGGMISYRLACDLGDAITAIGAVASTDNYSACQAKSPVSVIHIHSLQDDHILYEGGCGPACLTESEGEHNSIPNTISAWVERNQCNPTPQTTVLNDSATCDTYTGCANGTIVKLCSTKDGGHSWPGVSFIPNVLEKNKASQALDATDEVWAFFNSFQ